MLEPRPAGQTEAKGLKADSGAHRIHRAFENQGYMHMCLMLSACQWAWVTGSMNSVRIPFLYHKAATYQFARGQLTSPQTAQGGDTMLAISALALTEASRLRAKLKQEKHMLMQ